MRGIHMHNIFKSGTDFWGGTWIRRTAPFREAWVLAPLMAFLARYGNPFAMEDGGQLVPMAAELIYRLAILVVVRRFRGMVAADSRSLR
jgi:hypothetical protein